MLREVVCVGERVCRERLFVCVRGCIERGGLCG